jgi:hypothetical protein
MALKIIGWCVHGVSIQGIEKMVGGGRSTPMRAGSWRRTTFPMGVAPS